MKISIVNADSLVGIDGVFRSVDLTEIDETIHAVQFDTALSKGRIWFKAETDKGQADVTDIAPYQVYIDRWTAAAPVVTPPAPPLDQSDFDNIQKSIKALGMVVAAWNGKTVPQLKSAFKSAWDSLP